MWDVMATSFISLSEYFTLEGVMAKVSDRPPNSGQTIITENGHSLKIATGINKEIFNEFVLRQL